MIHIYVCDIFSERVLWYHVKDPELKKNVFARIKALRRDSKTDQFQMVTDSGKELLAGTIWQLWDSNP